MPALGRHARALGTVDALVVACVHRVAHHDDADEHLIWVYDIDRLARAMTEGERTEFLLEAREHDIASICRRGLGLAGSWFGAPVADLCARLDPAGAAADPFLGSPRRRVQVLVSDLRSLPTLRARLRLLREHLFPPVPYMLEHYGIRRRALLPAYYVHRLFSAVRPWLRQPRGSGDRWLP
jgi:hypothetical protein